MALDTELETFRKNLPTLLKEEGRFALVHDSSIEGTYDTYRDALKAGYTKFRLGPFLVKKIEAVESILRFNRELWPT
ncbi:MAG: hypothetical protein ACHQNE_10645 [Candidatus Kapaibacterium sp.]